MKKAFFLLLLALMKNEAGNGPKAPEPQSEGQKQQSDPKESFSPIVNPPKTNLIEEQNNPPVFLKKKKPFEINAENNKIDKEKTENTSILKNANFLINVFFENYREILSAFCNNSEVIASKIHNSIYQDFLQDNFLDKNSSNKLSIFLEKLFKKTILNHYCEIKYFEKKINCLKEKDILTKILKKTLKNEKPKEFIKILFQDFFIEKIEGLLDHSSAEKLMRYFKQNPGSFSDRFLKYFEYIKKGECEQLLKDFQIRIETSAINKFNYDHTPISDFRNSSMKNFKKTISKMFNDVDNINVGISYFKTISYFSSQLDLDISYEKIKDMDLNNLLEFYKSFINKVSEKRIKIDYRFLKMFTYAMKDFFQEKVRSELLIENYIIQYPSYIGLDIKNSSKNEENQKIPHIALKNIKAILFGLRTPLSILRVPTLKPLNKE